jgi:hypothetical protein
VCVCGGGGGESKQLISGTEGVANDKQNVQLHVQKF